MTLEDKIRLIILEMKERRDYVLTQDEALKESKRIERRLRELFEH